MSDFDQASAVVTPRARAGLLVLPVSFESACLWAGGQLEDADLIRLNDFSAPAGEAIWICSLFGSRQVLGMVREICRWPAARVVVFRSASPEVLGMIRRYRPEPVTTDADGRRRWWIMGEQLREFRARFNRHT